MGPCNPVGCCPLFDRRHLVQNCLLFRIDVVGDIDTEIVDWAQPDNAYLIVVADFVIDFVLVIPVFHSSDLLEDRLRRRARPDVPVFLGAEVFILASSLKSK